MKKPFYLILCVTLFFSNSLTFSQTCLAGDVLFTTQLQIDEFPLNYPNCTEILGDVEIKGNDIVNLNGLNAIVKIDGNLDISYSNNLNSLIGLESLTTIGGYLEILSNSSLTSLNGLNSLNSIGWYIVVAINDSLNDLSALSLITSISQNITISRNPSLQDLNGLHNVGIVGTYLLLNRLNIPNLNSLSSLNSIPSLLIRSCDELISLEGLESVNLLNKLEVIDNAKIETLNGIHDAIPYNGALSFNSIKIQSNPNLTFCSAINICTHLDNGGSATITNNGSGCNSITQINSTCNSLSTSPFQKSQITIYPTIVIDKLTFSGIDPMTEIHTFDISGKAIKEYKNLDKTIDLSSYKSGIYFIQFKTQNFTSVKKIIKL